MKKKAWKSRIKKACEAAGTYQPFFDSVIDMLAGLLETRDRAREQFEESGGETVIEYTNKSGNTNTIKNPALVVVMDCESQALICWRELGLTPAGLKRISTEGITQKPKDARTTTLDAIRAKHRR